MYDEDLPNQAKAAPVAAEPVARMTTKEALRIVYDDLAELTPEELRAELDRNRNGDLATTLRHFRETPATPPASDARQEDGGLSHEIVSIPRDLISAACAAIAMRRRAPNTLAELRRYTTGDLSRASQEDMEMRADAERYRKLRQQHWYDSPIAVVVNPKQSIKMGSVCPSEERLDEIIDGLK